MRHADRHRTLAVPQIREPHFLQEDHLDVAFAFAGRALQRVSKLLDLVADSVVLEGGGHNGQAIVEALRAPTLDHSLVQVAKTEPESEMIRVSVVIPNAGSTINAELGYAAVPRE